MTDKRARFRLYRIDTAAHRAAAEPPETAAIVARCRATGPDGRAVTVTLWRDEIVWPGPGRRFLRYVTIDSDGRADAPIRLCWRYPTAPIAAAGRDYRAHRAQLAADGWTVRP